MVTRRTLLTSAGAAIAGSASTTTAARADATVGVDPNADQGTWEGWGAIRYDGSSLQAGAVEDKFYAPARFGQAPDGPATRWSTATSGSGNSYTARQDLRVPGKRLGVPFAAGELQTAHVEGVSA